MDTRERRVIGPRDLAKHASGFDASPKALAKRLKARLPWPRLYQACDVPLKSLYSPPQPCQSTRGLSNHYNKCQALKSQRAAGVSHAIAVDSAAVEAASAALAQAAPEASANFTDEVRPASPFISPPSPLPHGPGGRPRRRIRLPKRYQDEPPPLPTAVEVPVVPREPSPPPMAPSVQKSPPRWVKTEPNAYGLYRIFPNQPTHDPEATISLDNLCKSPDLLVAEKIPSVPSSTSVKLHFRL
ncbi:hypothetical protein DFH07DRAFT_764679 [Mycena maculata]|uniref:Uncharacterized protein n=1 Tax=Mycena maculata TaxID=230809 RepID=A0AAD7KBW5_9AGAR|nr:hypothetical protein DFH07DRAFT_764679 [Mycena maculata]